MSSKEEEEDNEDSERCGKDAAILQELKEISKRHSPYNKSLGPQVSSSSSSTNTLNCIGEKENSLNNMGDENKLNDDNQDCNDNTFLSQTNEKRDLNQYWYSKHTIDTLCNAVREGLSLSSSSSSLGSNARVAFLSTPSLFFSLSSKERQQCILFDVSFAMMCLCWLRFNREEVAKRRPKVCTNVLVHHHRCLLFFFPSSYSLLSLIKRGRLVQSIISMTTTTQRTLRSAAMVYST